MLEIVTIIGKIVWMLVGLTFAAACVWSVVMSRKYLKLLSVDIEQDEA